MPAQTHPAARVAKASDGEPRKTNAAILVLGIETSCDETAAAIVARNAEGQGEIRSSVVRSQWEKHRAFGGVVPEIAARAHVECLDQLILEAMAEAQINFRDIDVIAATAGPGLIGGLMVGLLTAKMLALAHHKPLLAVNHLEAHALTVGLTDALPPPYLLLLVSGGHTQLLAIDEVGSYRRLGSTIDDALGEAFDKTAKLLGLPMPGGPAVEAAARTGDRHRFALPRPMLGRPEPHFSFAGLKTAVRHAAMAIAPLTEQDVCDLCASFQAAVADSVVDRTRQAMRQAAVAPANREYRHLVVAGGVAANQTLRSALTELARTEGYTFHAPPQALCGDNAAMIAWAAAERYAHGQCDSLDAPVRPRWPLDTDAAPALGSGSKGAKA